METLVPLLFVGCMLVGVYFFVTKVVMRKKDEAPSDPQEVPLPTERTRAKFEELLRNKR